jgi:hypothetical protein
VLPKIKGIEIFERVVTVLGVVHARRLFGPI